MHRLPKSFAPLPDRRAPEFRAPETNRIPTGVHGAPGHFSPDVVHEPARSTKAGIQSILRQESSPE